MPELRAGAPLDGRMHRVGRTVRLPFLIAVAIMTVFCGIQLYYFYIPQNDPLFETFTYDSRVRFAGKHSSQVATNLAVVFIDDEAFKLLRDRFGYGAPWYREFY